MAFRHDRDAQTAGDKFADRIKAADDDAFAKLLTCSGSLLMDKLLQGQMFGKTDVRLADHFLEAQRLAVIRQNVATGQNDNEPFDSEVETDQVRDNQ